jgi:hypothetical protein
MTGNVAADPDPYFALPKLYGAPAYARPPRVVPESERPPDPDDLPIAAEQTEEERALAEAITLTPDAWPDAWPTAGDADGASSAGDGGGRWFGLRTVTGRLGSRPR